ncbi:hypothetical protein SmJEL517_g01459 [Synchytrium microbalum]|uniref:TLC domain-containing protein n=1 Tax=Synchytrium microbalum TaxID=1806994 RepID=A0A507CFT7_9FUNG|nr:uncharacterized protein SmJEL517_g01459 [Synchytrium microbalum]TPX36373.1 hypothetical protein SmJEL517_g01459 [Synchytrium microbalum]
MGLWVSVYGGAYIMAKDLFATNSWFQKMIAGEPKNPAQKPSHADVEEAADKVVSTLNAIISTVGVVIWYFEDMKVMLKPEDFAFSHSAIREYCLCITGAYMMFDFGRILYYLLKPIPGTSPSGRIAFLIHHIVVASACFFSAALHYGTFYTGIFSFGEFTTVLLNLRFFLSKAGYRQSPIYTVNEYLFAILFFGIRVVGGWIMMWHMQVRWSAYQGGWEEHNTSTFIGYLVPACGYTHCVLQCWWFGMIVRMMYRKMKYNIK